MKTIISLALVLISSLLHPAFGETDIYVAYGDSITRGYPEYTVNHSGGRLGAYIPELEAKLASRGCTSHIHNWGRGGSTTVLGYALIDDTLDLEPDAQYLLLMYGANDKFNGVSANTTKANLKGIIGTALSEYGVSTYLSTITPNTKRPELNFNQSLVAYYNPRIRDLASELGVPLVDNYPVMCGGTGNSCPSWPSYTTDGLHIGSTGYTVMTDVWFTAIIDEIVGCTGFLPAVFLLLLDD